MKSSQCNRVNYDTGFIDPRRLAKIPTEHTPVDMVAVKDDAESLADELRDLGLDFMLEEGKGNIIYKGLSDMSKRDARAWYIKHCLPLFVLCFAFSVEKCIDNS